MKRKTELFLSIIGAGIILGGVLGGKWLNNYSKYIHFKNKELMTMTNGSVKWRKFYDMEFDKITKQQAKQITEIYIEALYGADAEFFEAPELKDIESFDDLLNFPNVKYIRLGMGSTYETRGKEVREEYLEWFPVEKDAVYPHALKTVLGKLEHLEWVQVRSDLVFEDLQMISQCRKLDHLEICQNQLKSLNGIEDIEIRFADFPENSLNDISALESAKSIKYLILNDNPIQNYNVLLKVEGLKAVSFDMNNENAKQVAKFLNKKGCIATNDALDVYQKYWNEIEDKSD